MSSIFTLDQMSILEFYEFHLQKVANLYCLGDTVLSDSCTCNVNNQTYESKSAYNPIGDGDVAGCEDYLVTNQNESAADSKLLPQKRLLIQTYDFSQNIKRLLATVSGSIDQDKILVFGKRKSEAKVGTSNRRSQFTGVFRNGDNWQAFISIDKRKTYLGTYDTQEEAAEVFDYYSLLLNLLVAKTNFNYSKRDIVSMIEKFAYKTSLFC